METDLISKKDLLVQTGISYGQLYRWKRKGLIPEDWFVRKSTFTGQETFFPRERMLARVEKVLSMKDEDLSLDDIAEAVSPAPLADTFARADIEARGIASAAVLDLFAERHPGVARPSLRGGRGRERGRHPAAERRRRAWRTRASRWPRSRRAGTCASA